jgi:phosphoesterase RecJ-like protein
VIALFTEKDKEDIKISFRSKGSVNVADFARSLNPDGGGHIRAAGCAMKGSLNEVKSLVLKKLEAVLK